MRIRNLLLDTPDLVIETSIHSKQNAEDINGKNTGSFIQNYDQDGNIELSTINNVVGKHVSHTKSLPLFVASSDVYGQINSAYGDQTPVGDVVDPKQGIIYLGLKMATIDGSTNYKYVRSTFSNTSQVNIPDNVLEYNDKLIEFISDTIRNAKDIREAYTILRNYVVIDEGSDVKGSKYPKRKDTFYIRTTYIVKGEEYKFKVQYDENTRGVYITSPGGSVNLTEGDPVHKKSKLFERAKQYGIRRAVNMNKGVLPTSKFTDMVTNTEYETYTQYLVETGAILSEYGSVRDNNGNLISNASPTNSFSKTGYNMKIYVDVSPNNVRGAIIKKKETTEVTDKHTTLNSYANALVNSTSNPYAQLFTMFDELGVEFDSTYREDLDELAVLRNGKELVLSNRFDTEATGNKVRLLAHESIHGIVRDKITETHLNQLSDINGMVSDYLNSADFAKLFNERELSDLSKIVDIATTKPEEVITYGLTNSIYARALNNIQLTESNEVNESLVMQLLNLIKELIAATFNNTALDKVASILEDILFDQNESDLTNENDITPNDLTDMQSDILNDLLDMKAEVSDIITTVPNAVSFLRTLNKEDRATAREMINNGSLIFKCK